MTRSLIFRKLPIKAVTIPLCCALGFMLGVALFSFFGEIVPSGIQGDFTSAFESPTPFLTFISCAERELRFALILYLFGFCLFSKVGTLALLIFKSALAGFSSVFILASSHSPVLYFLHLIYSLLVIVFLSALSRSACDFSQKQSESDTGASSREILSYSAISLFYSGGVLACLVLRHIILSFI